MDFHLKDYAGLVQVLFQLVASYGIYDQFKKLYDLQHSGEDRTAKDLNLPYFFSSFGATWTIILVGITRPTFDHWLVWVRYPLLSLWLGIFWYLYTGRQTKPATLTFGSAISLTAILTLAIIFYPLISKYSHQTSVIADRLVVLAGFCVMVGKLVKSWQLYVAGTVGTNSRWMEPAILVKEFGVLVYAVLLEDQGKSLTVYSSMSLFALLVGSIVSLRTQKTMEKLGNVK